MYNNDSEGQRVGVNNKNNGNHQRWVVRYLDDKDYKDEPTSGESKDFGFSIGRPFYIVSAMPMRRVIDVNAGRFLGLKSYKQGSLSQQWVFDGQTKTV